MGKEDFMRSKQLVERPCKENDHEKFHELKVKVMVLKGTRGQATSSRSPITVSIRVSLNSCFDYQSSTLTEEEMAYTEEFCVNSVWECGREEKLQLRAEGFSTSLKIEPEQYCLSTPGGQKWLSQFICVDARSNLKLRIEDLPNWKNVLSGRAFQVLYFTLFDGYNWQADGPVKAEKICEAKILSCLYVDLERPEIICLQLKKDGRLYQYYLLLFLFLLPFFPSINHFLWS